MDSFTSETGVRAFIARFNNENPQFKRPYQIPPIPLPYPPMSGLPDINHSSLEFLDDPIPTFWEVNPNKYNYFLQLPTCRKYFSPNEIRMFVSCPDLAPSNMKMELKEGGSATPAHLPNIDDLREISPTDVDLWIKWYNETDETDTTIVSENLCWKLDAAPILPQKMISYTLTAKGIQLDMRRLANAFYTAQMQKEFKQVQILGKTWWDEDAKRNMVSITMNPLEDTLYSWKHNKYVTKETCSEEEWSQLLQKTSINDPMTVLAWNARGIARPSFKTNIAYLCDHNLPNFVFIAETKTGTQHTAEIIEGLRFNQHFVVEPKGLSRGMLLMWDSRWVNFIPICSEVNSVHGILEMGTTRHYASTSTNEAMYEKTPFHKSSSEE